MDKTASWCEEAPFPQFKGATSSYVDEPDPVEETVASSADDLDEIFSEDDYDFVTDRIYPHTGRTVIPPTANKHGHSSNFTPADVDLLNRLIESQFGPGHQVFPSEVPLPLTTLPNRRRTSPLITSEVLENISSHNFPPGSTDADVPTLLYQFDGDQTSNRIPRHQPRRVKFVYEDPAARHFEDEPVVKPTNPVPTVAAPGGGPGKPAPKGKGKSPGKDKAAGKAAAGGKGKAAKNPKAPIKSPHSEPPPVALAPPLDPLIWEVPVWQTDNQTHLQFYNKKPWIVQKKRRKHWLRLEKLTTDGQEPDTRPPLWTKAGDRIARHYSLRAVIKNPKTMQLFFFQKKKRYVLTALRAFFLFSEQSTRMKLRILSIPGVVRRLFQIITFRSGLPQRLAIMLLSSLSHTSIFLKLFIKANALTKLEPLFRNSRDLDLNIWLSLLIRNISQNKVLQAQFVEMHLMDVMLDLVAMKGQDPDVIKYLLQTLYFLCRNRTIRTYLVVRGTFTALGELLFSSYRYIQYLVLRLVHKLLRTKSGKPIYRFDKADGMSLLVAFISDITQRKFFPLCIEIFQYTLLAPAIARKMIENGLYRILMDLAMEKAYEHIATVQEFALKTVTRAAELEEERRIMHELGYEAQIVFLLKSNEVKVQVAALQAMVGLCRRATNQTKFFDLGAHRIILFMMEGAHSDVREWAFYAIAFLIFRNKRIMHSMVSKGLGDVIYEALLDDQETWETKGNALLCAVLLRKNEQIHQKLRISIAQSIPHWLLNANKRIRNYAAVSIGIFVADGETRRHFAECKGYKALSMACIMSEIQTNVRPDVEFMRNLCFGLAALAVDEETVWMLINADSLAPLWLLKNEPDRVSRGYVGLALHRLVMLDSIFRYSLLGKLESHVRLPHGLHDQGVPTLANPLRPIEYFFSQGLMTDRTIVYISLPKRYWKRVQTSKSCAYRAPKDGLDFLCDHHEGKIVKNVKTRDKPMGLEQLEHSLPPQDYWVYAPYNPNIPPDGPLKTLMKHVRNVVTVHCAADDIGRKIEVIAEAVVEQMGGRLESRTYRDWIDCVDVGLSFLKRKLNSNCVPISAIEQGNALHRALLFKVLADASEIHVTLIRGESPHQGWIEFHLEANSSVRTNLFVVDLLYNAGQLLPKTGSLAKQYTSQQQLPGSAGNVAERPSFLTRDVRPLRGVMSQARLQLLQSNAPLHSTKLHPERAVQVTSGRDKIRLFRLTHVFDGQSSSGRSQYRTRLVKLFRNFVRSHFLRKGRRSPS